VREASSPHVHANAWALPLGDARMDGMEAKPQLASPRPRSRRADLSFALPRPPRSAVLLGDRDVWVQPLRDWGVELLEPGRGTIPDLVVAPGRLASSAAATRAPMLILEGAFRPRPLQRAGYAVRRFLPMPNGEDPELFAPLDDARIARYALHYLTPATDRWKLARNRLAEWALQAQVLAWVPTTVAIASKRPGVPFALAAARETGLPADVDWLLRTGHGDPALKRNVFYLFSPGEKEPRWILKLARRRNYTGPFDREEVGLIAAAGAGSVVASRAPRHVGRFEAEGLQASLETAAAGTRLIDLLRSTRKRSAKIDAIDRVAAWLVEVAAATAAPPETLDVGKEGLTADVVPPWEQFGAPRDLVSRVPPIQSVFQHNDLWSANVLVDGEHLTVLDWEAVRPHGFPLWDLLYFLSDAIAVLDECHAENLRVDHFVRLFRGELPSSPHLIGWLNRALTATSVPREAVGAIATLCWLDKGLRPWAGPHDAPSSSLRPLKSRLAHAWLSDARLGPEWVLPG
jgi:hypothetical protein